MEQTINPNIQDTVQIAKKKGFIGRYWLIIMLAFAATVIIFAKIFLTKPKSEVVPIPSPSPVSWNQVTPGFSTPEQVKQILGDPESVLPHETGVRFLYPRQGGGPEHEVIIGETSVLFIKDRVLGEGNISSFKQKYGTPEAEYFGEHAGAGFKTYLWTTKGVSVIASLNSGLIFEAWYFEPQQLSDFLKTWGKNLKLEYIPQGY